LLLPPRVYAGSQKGIQRKATVLRLPVRSWCISSAAAVEVCAMPQIFGHALLGACCPICKPLSLAMFLGTKLGPS
jgi:hypothetical protein